MTTTKKKEEKIPYPSKEWFDKKELDQKVHILKYDVGEEHEETAFLVESINKNETKLIVAEHEQHDELGLPILGSDKPNDALILRCTSYGDPPKRLSQQELDKIKLNKKSGLYQELLYAVQKQSATTSSGISLKREKN